jgi:TP901 family phage tail tape measure protein
MSTAQASKALRAFVGEVQQAQVFVAGKQNEILERATQSRVQQQFPGQRVSGSYGAALQEQNPLYIAKATQAWQGYNNTIKQVTQTALRLGNGQSILLHQNTEYVGNIEKIITAEKEYARVLGSQYAERQRLEEQQKTFTEKRSSGSEPRTLYEQRVVDPALQVQKEQTDLANQARIIARQEISKLEGPIKAAAARVEQVKGIRDAEVSRLADLKTAAEKAGPYQAGQPLSAQDKAYREALRNTQLPQYERDLEESIKAQSETIKTATAERQRLEAQIAKAKLDVKAADENYARTIDAAAIKAAEAAAGIGRLDRELLPAEQQIMAGVNEPAGLPNSIRQLANPRGGSPELLKQLEKQGLGGGHSRGSPEYIQALQQQGAYEGINITKDLEHQVTNVRTQFRDLGTGIDQTVSAKFDNAGHVITRFGGQLSGLGSVLTQISRNFQKVIEWTVATTVVFGALAFAVEKLRTITEIDKSLRQLSITANLTREETGNLFNGLADAAFATATPLTEMIKAADDIALATRRAGQSTEEWQRQIISLSGSVGVLTNLAGVDTVKATDLLVASMKQLNLQADDIPGLLSKVTAVAGGQSNAIADVIQGLGTMAEASKQANLSIDETIATIQVLSQVTSKSPAEVATSFKNLVGSLGGPAAVKALATYNIALHDSEGNLRNILDVYREIQQKIQQGIIPQGQVQAVVRAISGGPRRSPDAAALLNSIGQIDQVTQKSINATNEAAIANAKALDTVQAKVVQLQNKLDKLAVNKFSTIVREVASSLLDVFSKVSDIISIIPPGLIVIIAQLGLFAGATKLVATTLRLAGGSIGGLMTGLRGLKTSWTEAGIAAQRSVDQMTQANLARAEGQIGMFDARTGAPAKGTKTFNQGLNFLTGGAKGADLANFGKGVGVSAIAGGVVAGAASGLDPLATIGGGLQGAGLFGLMNPAPILPLKALSAVVFGVGTAMQLLAGHSKDATAEQDKNTEGILNAITAYNAARDSVEFNATAEKKLSSQIDELQKKRHKSGDDNQLLAGLQNQYTDAVIKSIQANVELSDSFDKLKSATKDRAGFSQILGAAKAGILNGAALDDLKKKSQELAGELLQKSNPDFVLPSEFKLLPPPTRFAPVNGGDTTIPVRGQVADPSSDFLLADNNAVTAMPTKIQQTTKSVEELVKTKEGVTELINTAAQLGPAFNPSIPTLQTIEDALNKFREDLGEDDFKKLSATFQSFATQASALYGVTRNVAIARQYLQAGEATSLFSAEEVKNGNTILGIYERLVELIASHPDTAPRNALGVTNERAQEPKSQEQRLKEINTLAFNEDGTPKTTLNASSFRDLTDKLIEASGYQGKFNTEAEKMKFAAAYARNLGIEIIGITDDLGALSAVASETNADLIEGLKNAKVAAQADYGKKLADLQARNQGGEFKDNQGAYKQSVAQLEALNENAAKVFDTYTKLSDVVPFLDQQMQGLAGGLVTINGLQDAQSLTTDQLITRMLGLAETYGLSAKQVDVLVGRIQGLAKHLKTMNDLKLKFHLSADVDTKGAIAALRAMRALIGAGSVQGASGDQLKALQARLKSIDQGIADFQALDKATKSDIQTIKIDYSKGKGPSFGVGGISKTKDKKGFDVSELDLPDSIRRGGSQFAQRASIIDEAIRRARALQSKIPGATKDAKNDIVELLDGTKRISEIRGIKEEYLRRAIEELTKVEQKRAELDVSTADLPKEIAESPRRDSLIQEAIKRARALQHLIPNADKEAKNDVVELLAGTKRVLEVRGIKDDFLRKALEELADIEKKRLDFETKADTIRQIRVGGGDFGAIANVPVNTKSGVSLAGNQGGNITLNINGQVLTPAQLSQFADLVAAALGRQIANGGG